MISICAENFLLKKEIKQICWWQENFFSRQWRRTEHLLMHILVLPPPIYFLLFAAMRIRQECFGLLKRILTQRSVLILHQEKYRLHLVTGITKPLTGMLLKSLTGGLLI